MKNERKNERVVEIAGRVLQLCKCYRPDERTLWHTERVGPDCSVAIREIKMLAVWCLDQTDKLMKKPKNKAR